MQLNLYFQRIRSFLYVAKKLWKLLAPDDLRENVCVVVNLFDTVKDMINVSERFEVAKLFVLAGEKAMGFTAFEEALKYFESGIYLLDKDSWKTQYKFTFDIYSNGAKSAYCVKNYDKMKKIIEEILKNTEVVLDLVTPYLLINRMYSDERMYGDAISNALLLLDKLGASIDPNQTIEASTILQTKSLFEESMEDMREIEDEKILSIMRVLHEIGYSCWFSGNLNLVALVAVKMIELVF